MLTEGFHKVIGDGAALYEYLVNRFPNVKSKLYAEDQDQALRALIKHFTRDVRKVTSRLVRQVALTKVLQKGASVDTSKTDTLLKEFDILLSKWDERLRGSSHLSGEQMTIVDVMAAIEIHTVLTMYRR